MLGLGASFGGERGRGQAAHAVHDALHMLFVELQMLRAHGLARPARVLLRRQAAQPQAFEPLGSDVSLDVAPGIEVYVSTSASSIANIEGPTDKNQQDIVWSGSNTQRMQFSVSDNAQQGDYVKITIPISIDLNVGLNLDLLLFKHNIGQIQFGSFQAQPVIEEIIPIGSTLGSDVIIIIIIIAAAATGGGIFMYLRKKRVVKKTQTCKKCGTVLALSSKFCAKCGNKI